VEPSPRNGLRKPSQLMVDKLFTVPNQVLGDMVGQLEPDVLMDLDLRCGMAGTAVMDASD